MRTLFIILGAASVVYGGYLWYNRSKACCDDNLDTGTTGSTAGGASIDPSLIVTGPTKGGGDQLVDNSISMVEHFGSAREKFPPMTYIGIPVGDCHWDEGAVYQPLKF